MWTDGYVSDIDYTFGYYGELAPLQLRFALAAAGRHAPTRIAAPTYLELGYGQGTSLAMHAATNPGTYWGTDFLPSQAAHAQQLVTATGADTNVLEASFGELAARIDLPQFDAIVLHGIWSWISDENRAYITEIARKALKPGGVVYVSYNTMPGWAAAGPVQHLMSQYAGRVAFGSSVMRAQNALSFTKKLAAADAAYFRNNTRVDRLLAELDKKDATYVAHEYLNADWHPMPFADTAAVLTDAKLGFAADATLIEQIDMFNIAEDGRKLLASLPDPIFTQTVRDYMLNRQFRRDIFTKGVRVLSKGERAAVLDAMSFTLLKEPNARARSVQTVRGEIRLEQSAYDGVCEALDDTGVATLAQLLDHKALAGEDADVVRQAVQVLCGTRTVAPTHDDATTEAVTGSARALNADLCLRAELGHQVFGLAAPRIGGAIHSSRLEQLYLRAITRDEKDTPDWIATLLQGQGHSMVVEDKPLTTRDDMRMHIREQHAKWTTERRPLLQRLGVI